MKASGSNKELHELDRFFAETLNEASVKPSEDVWKDLEIKLDDKRKRRLLPWLILPLGLIVCSLLGYFFIPSGAFQKLSTGRNASVNDLRTPSPGKRPSVVIPPEASVPVSKSAAVIADASGGENNISGGSSKKIQLAALKNQNAQFPASVAGFEVKAEIAGNGLKKYFIEVRDQKHGSVESALNDIRTAGYKDAFLVKQNGMEAIPSTFLADKGKQHESPAARDKTVNNTHAEKISGPLAMNTKNHPDKSQESAGRKEAPASSNSGIVKSAPVPADPSCEKTAPATIQAQKETGRRDPETKANSGSEKNPDQAKENTFVNNGVTASSDKNSQGSNTVTASASFSSPATAEKNTAQNTTASVLQNTVTTSSPEPQSTGIPKTDSLARKKTDETKTDSGAVSPVVKAPEPGIPDLPFRRFGLYLLAGPEYMKPLVSSHNEKTALTFNGGLKLQYFISRRFAIELGTSYQTSHSSSDNDTLAFAKNLNYNTYIHSTYGDMTVDPATLMDGFSSMAPLNTFRVKYSYQLHYSVLNVPLNLKFYPVKRDKLSVSVTAGINSQKIISQSAQLVLYKESFNNVLNYNNLLSRKFSFSLLLGLGCELKLYKNIYVVAEPNLRYGFTNMNTTYGISGNNSKFLYFDGNAGLKIIF